MSQLRNKALMRKNILAHLQQFVYGPFDDYFNRELTAIIEANDALLGGRTYRFRFMGKIYETPGVIVKGPRGKVYPLYAEFEDRFTAVLTEKNQIDSEERPFVMNYLQKVLLSADDTITIIALLPSVLRRPFTEFMQQHSMSPEELSIDESGEDVNACAKSLALLKQRLMLNLLLGDR